MRKRIACLFFLLAAGANGLLAETFSYTGTLAAPEDVFSTTFTLAAAGTVTFQTWGFGGGTNASGQVLAAGGFDPLISLFSGPAATIVTDTFGNPLADADNLANAPWSFVGNCPAAGTVAIGNSNNCGDVFMQVALGAGTYTLLLTDANYIPAAVYDNGALSEGFVDFTSGVFQTCDANSGDCISPNGKYAVDILDSQSPPLAATPEPSTLSLLGIGFAFLAGAQWFSTRRKPLNA